jgi:hypothetical protein
MILNHRDAIEFVVGAAEDIGFNRYTILNLHALLANNLLPDPSAVGRLRHVEVGVERSVFQPLAIPQLIEECFDQLLATTVRLTTRTSRPSSSWCRRRIFSRLTMSTSACRGCANIPLIKANLTPLTFTDVSRSIYIDAMLGVYELNRIDLLKEVFIWAHERSAARYAAARQSLGEPDPFRLRHRADIGAVVGQVVRSRMNKKAALAHLNLWAENNIDVAEREQFREVVESELLGLHEGNFARYRIAPSEFRTWKQAWAETA